MGDTATDGGVAALVGQLNRFAPPAAPVEHQVLKAALPLATGNVTMDVALPAVVLYQRRATAAYQQFQDAGSLAVLEQANQAFTSPVAFVTANLANVTNTIASYGDSVGLAPAASGASGGGVDVTQLAVLAGVGLAVWWMMRKS